MPFFAGLDLGQAHDFTALVIPEQLGPAPHMYHVRHIERWPLGTPYPAIVGAVAARMGMPQLRRQPLVIDGTGCGRPVVDLFKQVRGLTFYPVLITGGDTASKDEAGYWRVPKRDLVGVVQVLLQSERLKIADALPEARTLTAELLNFQAKISDSTAHDSYGAWREGTHDDVVLALALALWLAERTARTQPKPAAPIGMSSPSKWRMEG